MKTARFLVKIPGGDARERGVGENATLEAKTALLSKYLP